MVYSASIGLLIMAILLSLLLCLFCSAERFLWDEDKNIEYKIRKDSKEEPRDIVIEVERVDREQ